MSPTEETLADFAGAGMTVGPHAMEHVRERLDRLGILRAADLIHQPAGARRRTAGSVIVRQRPGTAKGLLFLTLEDETGMCQALVTPDLLAAHRRLIVGTPNLVVEGVIQKKDGSVSLRADRFWPLQDLTATPSHDFR
jgi:error-prone DNA polymerase